MLPLMGYFVGQLVYILNVYYRVLFSECRQIFVGNVSIIFLGGTSKIFTRHSNLRILWWLCHTVGRYVLLPGRQDIYQSEDVQNRSPRCLSFRRSSLRHLCLCLRVQVLWILWGVLYCRCLSTIVSNIRQLPQRHTWTKLQLFVSGVRAGH